MIAADLEALLPGRVTVREWTRLEPWTVARARLDSGETVIVKWRRSLATSTEVAALRFLSEDLGLDLAPRVIAAGSDAVVLEDFAPRAPLDQLIRRDGPRSEWLMAFAEARGELNGATAGHVATYRAHRASDRYADRFARHREQARGHVADFGAPFTAAAERELAAALEALTDPGPFLALSNGDPEANNALVLDEGPPDVRLIDFEFAEFTHALHDAVCLHVPGPGWLSVDDQVAALGYRRALARWVPQAEDDQVYGFALAAACMSWALVRLERLALLDTRSPGDDSRLQLVATLEAAARTAGMYLPHLAGWARGAADMLRRRWPDTDRDLAAIPPYAPRLR